VNHPWSPKCPFCGNRDLKDYVDVEEASDRSEDVKTTHLCEKCHRAFRIVPPSSPEIWP
jgi:transcriptional regulator NrdR family protein